MKGLIRSTKRNPASQAVNKMVIRLKAVNIEFDGAADAVAFGTVVAGDLPQGNIAVLGASAYLKFTKLAASSGITATFDGDFSLGTAPTADNSLSGAEVNLIPSTAFAAAAVDGATGFNRGVSAVPALATVLDNTDGSAELNLNVLLDNASINADNQFLQVDGTITVLYSVLGDD